MIKVIGDRGIKINGELFDEAFKGLAYRVGKVSETHTIEGNIPKDSVDMLNKILSLYEEIYSSLPFPINATELDIKYAVIGNCIGQDIDDLKMWVDNGLNIMLDKNNCIHFNDKNWVIDTREQKENNTDIEHYKESIGYDEYKWALETWKNKRDLSGFYAKFMRELVVACKGSAERLKNELVNIMTLSPVPMKRNFELNTIFDTKSKVNYKLDIFESGKRPTNRQVYTVNVELGAKGKKGKCTGCSSSKEMVSVYDFSVFKKVNPKSKMEIDSDNEKFITVFDILLGKILASHNPSYIGLKIGERILLGVGNELYVCNTDSSIKPVKIGNGLELYSYDKENLFISHVENVYDTENGIVDGIGKTIIYKLNINTLKMELCKIEYK